MSIFVLFNNKKMNSTHSMYQCELCEFTDTNENVVVNHINICHKTTDEETTFWNDAHAISVCEDTNADAATASSSNCDPNSTVTWTEQMTKLLLDLYKEKKPLVERGTIKTSKLMWKQIVEEMLPYGYNLTCLQVENKWKSLERMYKNVQVNKKSTGRGRKSCPYEREMDEILSGRHSINPVYTIESSNTVELANNLTDSESNRSTPEPKRQKPVRSKNIIQQELQNLRKLMEDQSKKRETYEELRCQQRNDIIEQMKIKNELLKKLVEKQIN